MGSDPVFSTGKIGHFSIRFSGAIVLVPFSHVGLDRSMEPSIGA